MGRHSAPEPDDPDLDTPPLGMGLFLGGGRVDTIPFPRPKTLLPPSPPVEAPQDPPGVSV